MGHSDGGGSGFVMWCLLQVKTALLRLISTYFHNVIRLLCSAVILRDISICVLFIFHFCKRFQFLLNQRNARNFELIVFRMGFQETLGDFFGASL